MSDFDLLVRSAERDLAIADGKFVAVGANIRGNAIEEIDATNMSIFPGVIDAHVHFNEPGRTDWEGFKTGAGAAAAGGTTTVFDMPLNAHPPTIDGPSFDSKRAAAEASSLIDFGLWGGLVPTNLGQLETLGDRGVVGLKAFMCNSGIGDFAHVDLATLREGMRIAADLGLLVAVHAESEELTRRLTGKKLAAGKTTVEDFLDSRPIEAELEAIRHAIDLAHETRCRLHIVHVSCARGVDLVTSARQNGADVTCETCPHYLVLTEEEMKRLGGVAKCAPPLRAASEQKALRGRIADVATIGSDHSPCPPEMKQRENFFEVWGGISGCQHLLPLLIDCGLSAEQIAARTGTNVASRFRIENKGELVVGNDADLAIVDLGADPAETVDLVTTEALHYRHRQSPYLGRHLRARVVRTILRGQTIFHNGKLATRSIGKFVRPARS